MALDTRYNMHENELLLTQRAVYRDNAAGRGVMLHPSGTMLQCVGDEDESEAFARLVAKLFNKGLE